MPAFGVGADSERSEEMKWVHIYATTAEGQSGRQVLNCINIEYVEFHDKEEATVHMVSGKSLYTPDKDSVTALHMVTEG